MRNGVDTATLFATLDAVKQAPEAASFQFRAHNQWVSGTHNRGTIADYFGVGEERTHERTFVFDADHPAVLVGQDNGPTPVEFVLHALAACLTAGLANIAAARKVSSPRSAPRSPATSTSTASSGSTLRCATATSRSPCASRSRATPRPRSCASSWSSREPARRSMTSSPTRCPSPSRWTPPDARSNCHDLPAAAAALRMTRAAGKGNGASRAMGCKRSSLCGAMRGCGTCSGPEGQLPRPDRHSAPCAGAGP